MSYASHARPASRPKICMPRAGGGRFESNSPGDEQYHGKGSARSPSPIPWNVSRCLNILIYSLLLSCQPNFYILFILSLVRIFPHNIDIVSVWTRVRSFVWLFVPLWKSELGNSAARAKGTGAGCDRWGGFWLPSAIDEQATSSSSASYQKQSGEGKGNASGTAKV